jgi:hypothetical protein
MELQAAFKANFLRLKSLSRRQYDEMGLATIYPWRLSKFQKS